MPRYEFVAGVLDTLDSIQQGLAESPMILAEEFLRSTLIDEPRPPWNTGELRNSGAVYIGGQKYRTTGQIAAKYGFLDQMGRNPRFGAAKLNEEFHEEDYYGMATDRHLKSVATTPKRFRGEKLRFTGAGTKGKFKNLRGKVTVVYQAPHAALMHEWPGKFTDKKSGAHYVSGKVLMAAATSALRIRANLRTRAMMRDNAK